MHEINDSQLETIVGGYSWAQYKADWVAGMTMILDGIAEANYYNAVHNL
jgi:hypothetical protein